MREKFNQLGFNSAPLGAPKLTRPVDGVGASNEFAGRLRKRMKSPIPLRHLFLFDIKETGSDKHQEYTGVPTAPIHASLFALDQAGAKIILRCPIIPRLNDREDHFHTIAALANQLKNVQAINILPYHPLGEGKLKRLGKNETWTASGFAEADTVANWVNAVQAQTEVLVEER